MMYCLGCGLLSYELCLVWYCCLFMVMCFMVCFSGLDVVWVL